MMPDVWTYFWCGHCGTVVAKGGICAHMICPCCHRLMERTGHRPEGKVAA